MDDNKLSLKARGLARTMSYDGNGKAEGETKAILLELAHRIDRANVRVTSIKGKVVFMDGLGKSRPPTLKEIFLLRVFGVMPKII